METSYAKLRRHMAAILDKVTADREVVIVRRGRQADVAMLPADELAGLLETVHLLRSPKNARRLLTALRRAQRGKVAPGSVEDLGRECGIEARG